MVKAKKTNKQKTKELKEKIETQEHIIKQLQYILKEQSNDPE